MSQTWNHGVLGTELPPLINLDADTIRCVAGPGSGKTFGLVQRVERILHPEGLAVDGNDVLVVAFNRIIARQLRDDIESRLTTHEYKHSPVIRTIHALCIQVIGEDLRMLLPHETDAMVYDIRQDYPLEVTALYDNFQKTRQALRDHEAGHTDHLPLWQAARKWLVRHKANLIGDLPRLLLERLKGGDFPDHRYSYVIVDEFQDLTRGEQELIFRLRRPGGQLVALGDPRQSIYRFRGNDRQGLANLETLLGEGRVVTDVPLAQCQRCPSQIVVAANRLMALSGVDAMVPVSEVAANIHVITWDTPEEEAEGMASAIVENIAAHPGERHLVMVTRRQFGYWLRDHIASRDPNVRVDLGFSEGLLESWAAREAFILFCLLVDPDRPTWRSWFGYKNSSNGSEFRAPNRNAAAYLQLLTAASDFITETAVQALAEEPRDKPRGAGGSTVWDRAKRFLELKNKFPCNGNDVISFVGNFFDPHNWIGEEYDEDKVEGATNDLQLLRQITLALLEQEQEKRPHEQPLDCLSSVAQRMRHQIATNEPLAIGEPGDLQVSTLWGAKGITAEHVYILGICEEAIPGARRDEYPGTDADYVDEQKRLFYVSITREKKTLVISRARRVRRGLAYQLGLAVTGGAQFWVNLKMSPFLHDIMNILPNAIPGGSWTGCA